MLISLAIIFLGNYFTFSGSAVGMFMALIGIGIVVAFFLCKQTWMVIHSGNSSVILFYKNSTAAREFSSNLMMIARKLNAPTAPAAQPKSRNDQRSRQQSSRNGSQQNSQRRNAQRSKDGRTGTFG
ncbi:MAG: hypothetical protein ABG776_15195 [Cyanobacteria bacterium J06555_13]